MSKTTRRPLPLPAGTDGAGSVSTRGFAVCTLPGAGTLLLSRDGWVNASESSTDP